MKMEKTMENKTKKGKKMCECVSVNRNDNDDDDDDCGGGGGDDEKVKKGEETGRTEARYEKSQCVSEQFNGKEKQIEKQIQENDYNNYNVVVQKRESSIRTAKRNETNEYNSKRRMNKQTSTIQLLAK